MLGLLIPVIFKILEWSLVTALVLTYIEIGPGGDSINAIVQNIKTALLNVDWAILAQNLANSFQDFFVSLKNDIASAEAVKNNNG